MKNNRILKTSVIKNCLVNLFNYNKLRNKRLDSLPRHHFAKTEMVAIAFGNRLYLLRNARENEFSRSFLTNTVADIGAHRPAGLWPSLGTTVRLGAL